MDSSRKCAEAGLCDGATVVVVGGGPAGAFFAIRLLRRARQAGRKLEVLILEKKKAPQFYQAAPCGACREGCNYCAGGISPKLAELLKENGLELPGDIVMSRAESLTVHGDWKSVELPVPRDKEMLFVFRGSRPRDRQGRYENFDSYLLGRAVEEGAEVVTGEVHDLAWSSEGRPVVSYRVQEGLASSIRRRQADLVVVAAGVNQAPGMDLPDNALFQALARMIPGFRPPRVRKALIGEVQADEQMLRLMAGEVHFAQYGSKDLHIEMSSLIPKRNWLTVALLGRSVDEAKPSEYASIIERFVQLPHIRRLLPWKARLGLGCVCHPNMTVGVARNPFGQRIAVIGDMVVARLYKDGILSAFVTATALADCALEMGVDRGSLKRGYGPVVRALRRDNRWGAVVFFLNRLTFSHPLLSRVFYQAVVTERKSKPRANRHLAEVLWRIASGDDSYGRVLRTMFHPATLWLIFVGGLLVTIRNALTECLFGLDWRGVGRYPTGVPREELEAKRQELWATGRAMAPWRAPQFERMYTIKVLADPAEVIEQLGQFGESRRRYFNPRLIRVHRVAGRANVPGSIIRYDVFLKPLSFSVVLEQVVENRRLVYRVGEGFAQGGILVFDIVPKDTGVCLLSIYVAFDFPKGQDALTRLAWWAFGRSFPAFVHDVLWNHALCELKSVVEDRRYERGPAARPPGRGSGPPAVVLGGRPG